MRRRKVRWSDGEWTGLALLAPRNRDWCSQRFSDDFPTKISPLSKHKPEDPSLTERFEIYIRGMEAAERIFRVERPGRAGAEIFGADRARRG